MKVAIVSKYKTKEIKRTLEKFGFKVVIKAPDFVLCYGGDGTILYGERVFPSVPKIVIKKSSKTCRKYEYTLSGLGCVLQKIIDGKYRLIQEDKLIATSGNKKLIGLNEIQIHNEIPTKTVRFSIRVGNRYFEDLLGDGAIVSTPYGSTAYFLSTGGRPFKKGIGISFNNLYNKKIKSFVVPENSKIEVRISRDSAWVISDNYEKFIEIHEGKKVSIRKANQTAKFVLVD